MSRSTCPFEKEYAEGSGYYGNVYLEKMRFLGSLGEDVDGSAQSTGEQETDDTEGFEIYDPNQDPKDTQKNEEMTKIANANWFWNFIGCADRETNLFYTQEADGIFGIMSMYESFDYKRAIESAALARRKSGRVMSATTENSEEKIVDEEVSQLVQEKKSAKRGSFYTNNDTPSIMNNLLVQGKVRQRRFAICLGYQKGYLNFDGWNSRTLRIMNYLDIKATLNGTDKSEEARVLLAKSADNGRPSHEWSERRETSEIRQLRQKGRSRIDFDRLLADLSEEILAEDSEELSSSEESAEPKNPFLEMNNVENRAIKLLEELSGEHIVRDQIQHIKIPRPRSYSFIYTGDAGNGCNIRQNQVDQRDRQQIIGSGQPQLHHPAHRSREEQLADEGHSHPRIGQIRHGHDDGLFFEPRVQWHRRCKKRSFE